MVVMKMKHRTALNLPFYSFRANMTTPTPKQTHTFIRKINNNTINEFLHNLSYVNWENVFIEGNVNVIFNNFLDTYLKIFYASFPIVKLKTNIQTETMDNQGYKNLLCK